jgi:diaminopimelate decarboxylase
MFDRYNDRLRCWNCGLGADVSSAGELATAVEAGFPPGQIFVAGPFKTAETLQQLSELPDAIVSVDSLSELRALSESGLNNSCVLRLRPDFGSCAVVVAGSECRFGFTEDDLAHLRRELSKLTLNVIGFHVFAGSQLLCADKLNEHLRRSLELAIRAAETLQLQPQLFNLGGGFGIPYGPEDQPLDLAKVGRELAQLVDRVAPADIVLELGRFLVAKSGWYLTSVLGHQTHQGRRAVVVDGGTHQRADMCGLCLRTKAYAPIALGKNVIASQPTDVLGNLSLPADVMSEARHLPELAPGDVLAFPNAGAYGVWSSPAIFHASPLPAEVAFDGASIEIMRARQPASSILNDQRHVVVHKSAPSPH